MLVADVSVAKTATTFLGLKCAFCKEGYKPTTSGKFVTACTLIANCAATNTWANSCS